LSGAGFREWERRTAGITCSHHRCKRLNDSSKYVQGKGFDGIQQEQMVITWLKIHPQITRADGTLRFIERAGNPASY
jgi:hypothetical protein